MKPIYIFDLDGTLADCTHRLPYIAGPTKMWPQFFRACMDDKPIAAGVNTLKTLRAGGAEIWIWTGRSDEVRDETIAWLKRHQCWFPFEFWMRAPERFLMRKAGDHRHDDVLKREWLSDVEPPEYKRIAGVFEDRARVVRMWRDAGIPCFQVADGDF